MNHSSRTGRLLMIAAAAACGGTGSEPTQPPVAHAPHLTVISGGGASDTIGARFAAPLVVELRDANDRAWTGASIQFVAKLPSDPAKSSQRTLRIASSATSTFGDTVSVTTDSIGRASIVLQGSTVAEQTRVDIGVVGQSLSASASFTVLSGAAVGFVYDGGFSTAVEVNGTTKINAKGVDRQKNVVGDPSYSVDPGYAIIDADGTVHASGNVGATPVTIRLQKAVETNYTLSLVPVARILASRLVGNLTGGTIELVMMGLDGKHVQSLVGPEPAWLGDHGLSYFTAAAGRDGSVYYNELDSISTKLWVREPSGAKHRLASDPTTIYEGSPAPSIDGQWIYYIADTPLINPTIWRVRPNGTGAEQIGPTNVRGPLTPNYGALNADPNGTTLNLTIYDQRFGTQPGYFDIASRRVVTIFPLGGYLQVYGPARDRFAYVVPNGAVVVRTIATAKEVFFYSQSTHYDISSAPFSPDGKWIVMTNGTFAIMNTETGQFVPIITDYEMRFAQWIQ